MTVSVLRIAVLLVGLLSVLDVSFGQDFDLFYKTENHECATVPLDECFTCDGYAYKCTVDTAINCVGYDDNECGPYPSPQYVARVDCDTLLEEYGLCSFGYVQENEFVMEVTSTNGPLSVGTGFNRDQKVEWTQTTTTASASGYIYQLTFSSGTSSLQLISINGDSSFTTSAGDCAVNATCTVGDLQYSGYWVPYEGNTTVAQPFGNYVMSWSFHFNDVTITTEGETYFRADERNLYLSSDSVTDISSVVVDSPSVYTLSSLSLYNFYSNTPFLQYTIFVNGKSNSEIATVCVMEEESLFGATAIDCGFPLLR